MRSRRESPKPLPRMTFFAEDSAMPLDSHDRKLLRALQRNVRQTHAELGHKVHLSPSSVRRRLDALRRSGAIRAEVALLDPKLLGGGISVIVMIAFRKETPRVYDEFQRRMTADAAVMQCYSISGEYDFAMLVRAATPADYEDWARKTLLADKNLARYCSFVVWSTVKQETQSLLPLTAD